mgnify:CR=1 FL=1
MFIALEKIMPAIGIKTWGSYQGLRCNTPWVVTTRVKMPPTLIEIRLASTSELRAMWIVLIEIQLAASSIRHNTSRMMIELPVLKM